MSAPSPDPDPSSLERLEALRRYQVWSTPPEKAFDRITDLAAHLFDVPIAAINLIGDNCQWSKSAIGLEQRTLDLDVSFCVRAIEADEIMVVEDARQDARFEDNPLVTGEPGFRFYAGAPLITPDGYRIGTLCIADDTPRATDAFDADDQETLRSLADVVVDELEYRATPRHRENILESITDAFFAVDGDWRITYVNSQAESLLQRTRQSLLGKNLWEEFPETTDQALYDQVHTAVREDRSVQFETYYPPREKWLQVNAYPFEDGLSVYLHDITERREMEAMLREREERVERLYDAMSTLTQSESPGELAEGIQSLIAGTLEYPVSAVWYAADDELTPAAIPDGPQSIPDAQASLNRDGSHAPAAAIQKNQTIHLTNGLDDRALFQSDAVQSVACVPIAQHGVLAVAHSDPDGIDPFDLKLLDLLAHNAASILDRIERESELRAARDEAEEMSRLKSAFLANMTHEIRTPLTAIIGFTEVLKRMDLNARADRFIQLIHRGGERLLETLDAVLDLSKLEAGIATLHPEKVAVSSLVTDVVEGLTKRASQANVELSLDLPSNPIRAHLDPSALERVVTNLVANAIKFTGEGPLDGGRVRVELAGQSDTLTLRVADTGVGIDASFIPHLFDAFQQESTGDNRAFEGSGLGLAITYQFVELMDGTIDVESTKGEGTTVTVKLPWKSAPVD